MYVINIIVVVPETGRKQGLGPDADIGGSQYSSIIYQEEHKAYDKLRQVRVKTRNHPNQNNYSKREEAKSKQTKKDRKVQQIRVEQTIKKWNGRKNKTDTRGERLESKTGNYTLETKNYNTGNTEKISYARKTITVK